MISNNMLEHIRKSIEEGELFASHVPVVKQLLESFDEQTTEIAQLRASRLAIVESLDAVMRERDLLKAQLATIWQPTASEYPIDGGSSHFSLRIRGNQLAIVLPEEGRIVGIFLPETLRLCEKVTP